MVRPNPPSAQNLTRRAEFRDIHSGKIMEAQWSGDFMIHLLIGPCGMLCANGPCRITLADFQIRQTIGNRSTSALCRKISALILVRIVSKSQ